MDEGVVILVGAALGAAGPTLAGLAAWNASRKNASQESVDAVDRKVKKLHDCLDRHTRQDELNFLQIDDRLSDADEDRLAFHQTLARIENGVNDAAQG